MFQTPADLLVKPNGEVNLSLTHQIPSYDMILWYQRSAGDSSLKLIGYVYFESPTIEPKFPSRFNVSGNGEKTAFLQIKNLKHPEDSGEYFGAATRHSNKDGESRRSKTSINDAADNSTKNHDTASELRETQRIRLQETHKKQLSCFVKTCSLYLLVFVL